jgi:DNA repair exonuclease SbcCD nuclease subunit
MRDSRLVLLGDPHLGRQFVNNVPLARRGAREKLQRELFTQHFEDLDAVSLHVMMGDLFDKPSVSEEALLLAIQTYNNALALHPGAEFVVIRGNHDINRDLTGVSSFSVFAEAISWAGNVLLVDEEPVVWEEHAFFPWHPTTPAGLLVAQTDLTGVSTVFGHWDTDPRSAPHNLIPTAELAAAGVKLAYTGHVHKPEQFVRDGVTVRVVGSMMPYAHGEETDDNLFVTLTLAEFEALDPETLKNKVVRLRLTDDEEAPVAPDCLQFSVDRQTSTPVEVNLTITTGPFKLEERLDALLAEHGVSKARQTLVKDRINAFISEV